MLVMDVVHVAMFMLERLMQMLVVVRLGEVQINANAHQQRRAHQSKGRCLAKQRQRNGCTDKGSCREVGAGTRSSQVPKTQHKKHQADPVAEEADRGRGGCLSGISALELRLLLVLRSWHTCTGLASHGRD